MESTRNRLIRKHRGWLAAALAAGLLAHPAGQTPQPPASPTFEVATVKPNRSGQPFINFGLQPGGRVSAINVPLKELIRMAYDVQAFQIDGGPGWINSDRFDVTAKAEGDVPPLGPGQLGPIQLMMQNLLAERFSLKVRRETREMPIQALVMARADGKLGPKIESSSVDCAAMMRGRGAGAGGRGTPPPVPRPGEKPECGMFMGPGTVSAGGVSMDQFALMLSGRTQRVVQNKTGLTGNYSFSLEFTPDQMPPGGALINGAPAAIDPNGPSLFTALQEQLGLKLESQRGPVEMLIIDSVSQPKPD
jgi:uncharacterized protein (TIGR03435 family)